ncbi:MAG: DoxX family membrane protein [Proteiniphilum sp.]|nr:DoxX family membrane protein [Proteiniphilum sp.]MDD3910280.1 DoxX family membrane protein [Proteiniphilum sp.]MDD4416339.1 DoxX family membrane protein [Proteiniphilum sp.]
MKATSKTVNIFVELSRIVVGATFVLSGFVKAVDPMGFTYKIQDYLIELNLTEVFSLALPVALLIIVSEFSLGVLLLLGVYSKWTTRFTGLFMLFFTPLTLWIAVTNPVEDCGCFGDAFIISNWNTFYKNIVLLAGTVLLIAKWKLINTLFSLKTAPLAVLFTALFVLFFALYNIYRLPVFDFRPYRIGANIPEQMYVDPEKADIYETIFLYSKNGVQQEFTEENYPWNDSTWTYVDMKTHLVKEGEKPKIEDFSVDALYYDESSGSWNIGSDITDIILSEPSYLFLMVASSLEEMNMKHLNRFKKVNTYAIDNGWPFYLITSSGTDVVENWEKSNRSGFQFCHSDEKVLETMIRSNPGLILLKGGTVINKWDDSSVPLIGDMASVAEQTDIIIAELNNTGTTGTVKLLIIALLFLIPLLLIKLGDRKMLVRKKVK